MIDCQNVRNKILHCKKNKQMCLRIERTNFGSLMQVIRCYKRITARLRNIVNLRIEIYGKRIEIYKHY